MKKILLASLTACLIISCFVSIQSNTVLGEAEENMYMSVEQYTNDDRLLMADGTPSSKKITDFANEVNAAAEYVSFPELTEVIPREYLETTEANAVYQHNGREYGFYLVKEGNYFDLLLIDFVYEFENAESAAEYIIKT